MASYLQKWKAIGEANDVVAALTDHFSYLVDVGGFEPVLHALMREVVDVKYTEEYLAVKFRGNETLLAYAPLEEIPDHYHDSYRKLLEQHRLIELEQQRILLGEHGYIDELDGWYDAFEEAELPAGITREMIVCPIWDYSDCWAYHPSEKNDFAEPVIYFLSHESIEISRPQPFNAGSLFLKRCVEVLELDVAVPAVLGGGDAEVWYNGLDDTWKSLLAEQLCVDNAASASKALTANSLFINNKSRISSLEPIRMMNRLEEINCDAEGVTNLSPLAGLRFLKELRFSGKGITDFSPINEMTGLTALNLSGTSIGSLTSLNKLTQLRYLDVQGTMINDISWLSNFPKLTRLSIVRTKVKDLSPVRCLSQLEDLNIAATAVTDFGVLNELFSLKILRADETSMAVLPVQRGKIHIVTCRKTRVSFREYLRFSSLGLPDDEDFSITMYSDHNQSAQAFLEGMESLTGTVDELIDTITTLVNNFLLAALKNEEDKPLCNRLMRAYFKVVPGGGDVKFREELAANALVALMRQALDEGTGRQLFDQMIGESIGLPRLAFNLACYHAMRGEKDQLIRFMTLTLQKGYDPARFRTEKDFTAFQEDGDFLALLANPPLPEPSDDPIGWWECLPSELKDAIDYQLDPESADSILAFLQQPEVNIYYRGARSLAPLKYIKGLSRLTLNMCKAESLEQLAPLENLKELEYEYLQGVAGVQYKDISSLAGLKNLEVLKLRRNLVEEISSLKGLLQLKYLDLWGSPVTDPAPLAGLINLESLLITIKEDVVVDLSFLAKLQKLGYCSLSTFKGKFKAASLEGVSGLMAVKTLYLDDMISVDGRPFSLAPLAGLKNLQSLSLHGVPFDNLEPLYALKNLQSLSIANPTEAVKAAVREHMPWCKLG
ncbi:hypothetical protein [Paraflavitalea sp. CAU 1676]|uniref:leucine-rich repeat domain-containing protein n=1 Tax=Paraflavitalea sp. CAU 1676 TaxID=3032598 RepID=UPI0023DB38F2|nr:hypothetical protein [Paraflavitalea sp. CAU 1676]MDF2187783.1 hypothetical protein [Paraflavitalea sp. CAU 1676]